MYRDIKTDTPTLHAKPNVTLTQNKPEQMYPGIKTDTPALHAKPNVVIQNKPEQRLFQDQCT